MPEGQESNQQTAQEALAGLGEHLKALRKERGLSLRSLAASAHLTASAISQIERNQTNPTFSSLYSLAEALSVRIDAFFPELSKPDPNVPAPHSDVFGVTPPDEKWGIQPGLDKWKVPGGNSLVTPILAKVVRGSTRKRLILEGFGGEIHIELLTAGPVLTSEFTIGTYMPQAHSCRPPSLLRHAGHEYFIVLEGELTVHLGFEKVVLKPGDSMAFSSSLPHRYQNDGVVPVRGIWFVEYHLGGVGQ